MPRRSQSIRSCAPHRRSGQTYPGPGLLCQKCVLTGIQVCEVELFVQQALCPPVTTLVVVKERVKEIGVRLCRSKLNTKRCRMMGRCSSAATATTGSQHYAQHNQQRDDRSKAVPVR